MRKKIDFLAILLVILLALSLGLGAVSVYCDHAYRETLSSNNALGELLDDLAAAADTGGAPAVENFDFSPYGLWEGKSDENFNAVLVDEDGTILARTGTLACGDMSTLDMMLARYDRSIELPAADGTAPITPPGRASACCWARAAGRRSSPTVSAMRRSGPAACPPPPMQTASPPSTNSSTLA